MSEFADLQADDMAFDAAWDMIPAESTTDFDWDMDDQRERDGWSEQYDYPDEEFGYEDAYLDSYWEAQGEAMLAFWGE